MRSEPSLTHRPAHQHGRNEAPTLETGAGGGPHSRRGMRRTCLHPRMRAGPWLPAERQDDPPILAEDGYAARQYGCSLLSAVHVLEQLEGGQAALEHYAHALVPWSALFGPAITVLSMRRRLTSLFSCPLSPPAPPERGPFATHPPSSLEDRADAGPPAGSKPRRRLPDAVASVLPRRDEGTVRTGDLPSYAREMARSSHHTIRVETDLDDEMPYAVVVANTQPLGAG
jgi:hypothetical protein